MAYLQGTQPIDKLSVQTLPLTVMELASGLHVQARLILDLSILNGQV